jgi:hypothetical protein
MNFIEMIMQQNEGFMISGLVQDVSTGKIEIVVPPSQLRMED